MIDANFNKREMCFEVELISEYPELVETKDGLLAAKFNTHIFLWDITTLYKWLKDVQELGLTPIVKRITWLQSKVFIKQMQNYPKYADMLCTSIKYKNLSIVLNLLHSLEIVEKLETAILTQSYLQNARNLNIGRCGND